MDRVVAFSRSQQTGNIRSLIVINPQAAHRIMYTRKNPHRHMTRVVANKHLVDLENRAELPIENICGDVGQVKVNLIATADTHSIETDLEDLARCDIARHQVAVRWILLFEKIKTLVVWNRRR